jgi:hypothetical protein
MEGKTSLVIQRRKVAASGLSERMTTSYMPGSLTMVICCAPPRVSI